MKAFEFLLILLNIWGWAQLSQIKPLKSWVTSNTRGSSVKDGTTALLDEPHLGLFLGDSLELAEAVGLCASASNTLTGTVEDNVEVHAENTSVGVVLNAEIDVFVDTETEVACY